MVKILINLGQKIYTFNIFLCLNKEYRYLNYLKFLEYK